ncbi:hypothetical protein Bbelb_110830 [Branchiostoma belcheri]|nr:hypothetical protein Bbelb_110830 [Branchiostoma belcheri]
MRTTYLSCSEAKVYMYKIQGTNLGARGRSFSRAETPRSYTIETETGSQLRRNRIHIMPTPEIPATTQAATTTPATTTPPTADSNTTAQSPTTTGTPISPTTSPTTTQCATKSTRSRSSILPPKRYR